MLDDDDVLLADIADGAAARRPITATRCASSSPSATSGRAPSGSAAFSSCRRTSSVSGSATATTTTPTPGRKSASPTSGKRRSEPTLDTAIEVVPATLERWDDVRLVLDGNGEVGCWCQPWRGRDQIAREAGESRPETLRRQLATFDVPPGFLAYVHGDVAGWCGIALRSQSPRLANSRTIPAIDEEPVWVIACFRVRVGHRRKGVAGALLDGVVTAARIAGAPGVEAYPIDPDGKRVDVGFAYVGLVPMFERAGFEQVGITNGHSAGRRRVIVRRMFHPTA